MAKLISKRYADAFFDLAAEQNKIDVFFDEAQFIYNSVANDSEFLKVLVHPDILSEEKLSMLESVFKGKVSEEFISLFALMLRKNRESEICATLKTFMDKVLAYKGITTAFVYSAAKLSEKQIAAIKEKLSANLNKQVNIQTEVDKSLIGGVKISVDGHVIDGTIKKQLDDLKNGLLKIQPAQ
jgi:F-type H+-transporting ATPase subunit delta